MFLRERESIQVRVWFCGWMRVVRRVTLMVTLVFDSVSWDCRKVVAASICSMLYRIGDHADAVIVQLDSHVFKGGANPGTLWHLGTPQQRQRPGAAQ